MFPVTPDFSQAQDFAPIAEGTHPVKAVDVSGARSKKGEAYLKWKLEVTAGNEVGKSVDFITMTEGLGAGILQGFINMLLPDYTGEGEFDAHRMLNKEFLVEIKHEPGQKDPSKMFAKVKNFKPLATAQFQDGPPPSFGPEDRFM